MSEFLNEFVVESRTPKEDFLRAIKKVKDENERRKKFLHVDVNSFLSTSTNIGVFHFIADGLLDEPKTIIGMPMIISRYKAVWENQLNTTYNIADITEPIPKVRFILDQMVEPPLIICRATL